VNDIIPDTPVFDLYTQPWVSVVRDGREVLASLRDCVTDAHLIDALSITDGPTFAGTLRLLVALVMDAYGQPTDDAEWAARRELGHFDADVLDAYIDKVGSRFDLFDAEHPFMQSATTPVEGKSVAELLPHVATGNRTPIFTSDTDKTPRPLTFPQAAQTLVATQAVAVPTLGRAAGDDPNESWSGVSFAGRAGIIGFCCPVGETLFETLMLNLPNGPHKVLDLVDLPVWRRDSIPHSRRKRFADGIVDVCGSSRTETPFRGCVSAAATLCRRSTSIMNHTPRCAYRTVKPASRSAVGIPESISRTQSAGVASRSYWPSVNGELIRGHRLHCKRWVTGSKTYPPTTGSRLRPCWSPTAT
jgi:CRISPR-associated protein Cse1 (CRISPR_cse1)